jgi:hypothetical protein
MLFWSASSDDAAPADAWMVLGLCVSTNMPALTGLVILILFGFNTFVIKSGSGFCKGRQAVPRRRKLLFLFPGCWIYGMTVSCFKAIQRLSKRFKAIQRSGIKKYIFY